MFFMLSNLFTENKISAQQTHSFGLKMFTSTALCFILCACACVCCLSVHCHTRNSYQNTIESESEFVIHQRNGKYVEGDIGRRQIGTFASILTHSHMNVISNANSNFYECIILRHNEMSNQMEIQCM